jgi:hypothetical protein
MTYELVKQLKDAGFPQEGEGEYIRENGAITELNYPVLYYPTLSELIAACEDGFVQLRLDEDMFPKWFADGRILLDDGYALRNGNGEEPEEAVANLYIALNEFVPSTPEELAKGIIKVPARIIHKDNSNGLRQSEE